jgi:hypothetical protein
MPHMKLTIAILLISLNAWARPSSYTELLDYVIEAPDQGETNTCLFVASTGAMEILLNKKYHLRNQNPLGQFDLSERYLISEKAYPKKDYWHVGAINKFHYGEAILQKDLPFNAWDGARINHQVWSYPTNFKELPRITVPKIETKKLFVNGSKWQTNVLDQSHIDLIKDSLWKYRSPVLVNYNDEGYWHIVLIVGFDDHLTGDCYDTNPSLCQGESSFYVRDSFGEKITIRDTDWFKVKGNAAFVITEAL